MHKIDSAGATADNSFTDGDPTIPTPATVVDAAWLNAVQEELAAVIEGAEIALDKENTTQLKTAIANMIAAGMSTLVPAGVITMWSGTVATIPTGWSLCDGENSTPDLRNRFIIGGGDTYTVGDTGGSTVTDATTLTMAQMPSHNHPFNSGTSETSDGADATQGNYSHSGHTDYTGGSQSHTHGQNLPPYYALAYIIKL